MYVAWYVAYKKYDIESNEKNHTSDALPIEAEEDETSPLSCGRGNGKNCRHV